MTQAEIEEILARIKGHEQVQGYIITNQKGEIIRNQFNDPAQREEGNRIASYIPELVYKTKVTCKNIGSKEDKTEVCLLVTLEQPAVHAHKDGQV
jgi:hypothetical protein